MNQQKCFAALLAVTMTPSSLTEQLQGNGNTVYSVEMDGNLAQVSFQTVTDCTLIVGVYDEAGETLYASGRAEVTPEDTEMQVEIMTDRMPEYFYVRGYLVDSFTLAPLSTVCECPNYTQEMQEFFAKTVDDFSAELVLNFDDDPANNFAVFKEGTVILTPESGYDTVVTADDENALYVIENADDALLSLQEGDLLSYAYGEDELLIVKVDAMEVDGKTVTIHGAETALEDVFAYLRIEDSQNLAEAEFESAEGAEVIYDEPVQGKPGAGISAIDIDKGDSLPKVEVDFAECKPIDHEDVIGETKVKLKGSLTLDDLALTVKIYISSSQSYIMLKIDYKAVLPRTARR